jgi:hypothetical protein
MPQHETRPKDKWEWIVYLFPAVAAACAISGGYAMGTKNDLVIGIWSVLTLGALALTCVASRRTRKG